MFHPFTTKTETRSTKNTVQKIIHKELRIFMDSMKTGLFSSCVFLTFLRDKVEPTIKKSRERKFKSRIEKYSRAKSKIHTKAVSNRYWILLTFMKRHKKMSHALANCELSNSLRSDFWKCTLSIDLVATEALFKVILCLCFPNKDRNY